MNSDYNNRKHINDLIIKFLDRQTTAEEEKELRHWISRSEENKRYFAEIQYLWNTFAIQDKTPFDSESAFKRFMSKIDAQQTVKNNR